MKIFHSLFGVKPSEIKKNCVLMPFFDKDVLTCFGIKTFSRGRLYTAANHKFFTLIRTGAGPAFLGDAVLYLRETACQNLILFGSCGLTEEKSGLSIASLVVPSKAYSMESFSRLFVSQNKPLSFYPDKKLLDAFYDSYSAKGIKKAVCATMGSLKLEEEKLGFLIKKSIAIVDMECSAFFSASKHTKLHGLAFFYISDVIDTKPFYRYLSEKEKEILRDSKKKAYEILLKFTARLNS